MVRKRTYTFEKSRFTDPPSIGHSKQRHIQPISHRCLWILKPRAFQRYQNGCLKIIFRARIAIWSLNFWKKWKNEVFKNNEWLLRFKGNFLKTQNWSKLLRMPPRYARRPHPKWFWGVFIIFNSVRYFIWNEACVTRTTKCVTNKYFFSFFRLFFCFNSKAITNQNNKICGVVKLFHWWLFLLFLRQGKTNLLFSRGGGHSYGPTHDICRP